MTMLTTAVSCTSVSSHCLPPAGGQKEKKKNIPIADYGRAVKITVTPQV